ncbi:MAG: IclR family transcriptional regulator [Anaerolineaceae bacterium]|nr:IclR family transcriptional regulator [Anaerolineaceae bacterium]
MNDTSRTLSRAIQLMDCFTNEHPQLGVREAARLCDLSPSTAGRLLASLKDLGLLIQHPETHQYALAGKVLAWAEAYSSSVDVRVIALPYIYEMQAATGETISLYVLEGDERVCVERLESDQTVRVIARIGRRLPLYAGSAGKLFLAYLPDERREEILANTDFDPFTARTITSLDKLREEMDIIRERGYAVSHGEWTIDASGVAAPIFNQRGQITAALTISGPSQRFTEQNVSRFANVVTQNALKISQLLGFRSTQKRIGIQPGRRNQPPHSH